MARVLVVDDHDTMREGAAMEADRGTLFLVDGARQELFSRAAHLPELSEIRIKLSQGVAGAVVREGRSINVATPHSAREFHPDIDQLTGYTTRSLLAVPVRDGRGEVFAVFQVLNRRGRDTFSEDDERRLSEISKQLGAVLEQTSLYAELQRAKTQPTAPVSYFFNRIVGESAAMRAAYRLVEKAAPTDATVLIRGESGTGKELFARALHVNSRRREKPMVKVDCAALPPSLIENELFGHEKGAFTGADRRVPGKFESADGGTIFLDELGELPLSVQGKLLRVIQDRELERVGGTDTVKVDVRIVAATHRDLAQRVSEGQFRQDLYFRIKVVEIPLPSLRERGAGDVERLARHFLAQAARKHGLPAHPRLTADAIDRLTGYRWPGNVRELEHCVEAAVVLSEGEIRAEHLPLAGMPSAVPAAEAPLLTLAEMERRHILGVLESLEGNRTAAAKVLGIGRNTLARKLREFGLEE